MEKSLALQEVSWKQIREEVYKVNENLAKIIDDIKPSDKLTFIKANYSFGDTVLQKNQFCLPLESTGTLSLNHHSIPSSLQNSLNYHAFHTHGIPLGLVLGKTVELYRSLDEDIASFRLYASGDCVGLWDIFSEHSSPSPRLWSMTAGARSVFFLPKISNRPALYKLCQAREIRHTVPKHFLEQAPLFYQLAHYHPEAKEFITPLLFFTKDWIEALNTKAFYPLRVYFQEKASLEMQFWRNKMVMDALLDSFVRRLWQENIKINTYTVYIVKHLLAIAYGALPGFAPSIQDEVGPLDTLKKDFLDVYGLKRTAPIMMIPQHISHTKERCVYWSLALPCHDISPKQNHSNSILSELKEAKILLEAYRDAVIEGSLECVKDTELYDFMANTRFEFYHSDVKNHEHLGESRAIHEVDSRFTYQHEKHGKRVFADASIFTRAMVRVRRVEE